MLSEAPPRALRLDIDRDALAANWRVLDRLSGKAHTGAAVKADAYGLGTATVVPVLHAAGCRDFFVAHWSEVAEVAALVDPAAISVLHGPLTPADAAYAAAVGVKPVINSIRQAKLWLDAGGGVCDLMVDTGMNRLGLPMTDLGGEPIRQLEVETLLSHLASADEDVPLNALQLSRWQDARRALTHKRASLANSAGILLGEAYHGDLTRPGLSLYGGVQRDELAGLIRQVVRPMATIIQTRKIQAGDTLGYNATFTAVAPMRVGTIALGYADGYLRCWSGKGSLINGGRRLPVLGRVSMDMTIIDLGAAPDLDEGDWVEVEYDLPAASATSGLSQYELITSLGRRFQR
ncbi:MAG TPA: alanine racemase [Novosphingobium sp.]